MERKDKLILLLLLAGAGYFGYTHWDTISITLGLDDIAPGRVKAIDLAKREQSFQRGRPNSIVLADQVRSGDIVMDHDAWQAQRLHGDVFLVLCNYRERGERHCHRFEVDVATNGVTLLEDEDAQPPK
jgi:hypothetical protein